MDIARRGGTARRTAMAIGLTALLATAACDKEGSSADCDDGVCHVAVRGHQSVSLGHDQAKVTHVGNDRMSLSWHGLSFTLKQGFTIKIGKYSLHLNHIQGGSAHVDVRK